tara:strand:+ start:238 stop:555 length:318 start_codon:yes stop_codon:yes gene_type:complete
MDFDAFKATLVDIREELMGRLGRTHHHLYEREERVSAKFSEQSQELESQELIFNLEEEAKAELKLVEEALVRITDRTFGVCQKCGEQVQTQRLNAVPYTRYCIDC